LAINLFLILILILILILSDSDGLCVCATLSEDNKLLGLFVVEGQVVVGSPRRQMLDPLPAGRLIVVDKTHHHCHLQT